MNNYKNIIINLFIIPYILVALLQVNFEYLGYRLQLDISKREDVNRYIIEVDNNEIANIEGTATFWSGECKICKPTTTNIKIKAKLKNNTETYLDSSKFKYKIIETKNIDNVECK